MVRQNLKVPKGKIAGFRTKWAVIANSAEQADFGRQSKVLRAKIGLGRGAPLGRLYLVSSAHLRCYIGRGGASLCPSACASRPAGSCAQQVVPSLTRFTRSIRHLPPTEL